MRAFIGYPREQEKVAREIASHLAAARIDVFFDKESLLPGEVWKAKLSENIQKADFVVVVCSKETARKVGEIQSEIRLILEASRLRPPSVGFVIPIRVEKAAVPTQLKEFNYLDFGEQGWGRSLLRSALEIAKHSRKKRDTKYLENAIQQERGELPFSIIKVRKRIAGSSVDIEYVKYKLAGQYESYINSALECDAFDEYYSAIKGINNWNHSRDGGKSYVGVTYEEFFNRRGIVSIRKSYGDYWAGTAHPNHRVTTLNFGGDDCGQVKIADLFDLSEEDAIKVLKRCDAILSLNSLEIGEDSIEEDFILGSFVSQYNGARSMLENFNIDDRGITFNFGSATGLPHAASEFDVLVPWQSWGYSISDSFRKTKIAKYITERRSLF